MALSCVRGLLVVGALVALGLLPVRLLLRPLPLLAHLGWSFLAGIAGWGMLLFAGSHLLALPLDALRLTALLVGGALIGIVGEAIGRRRAAREPAAAAPGATRPPASPGERAPVAAVVLFVALVSSGVIAAALTRTGGDWDGRVTWTAHARYMAAAASVDAPVLRYPRWVVAHPRYPPLLPLVQLAGLVVGGDEGATAPLYALFWPLLLFLAWEAARRIAHADEEHPGAKLIVPAFAVVLVGSLPFPAFFPDGGAIGAYSDVPLACLLGGGALLLLDERERVRSGGLAGVLLAGALLAKNEGAFLVPGAFAGAFAALLLRWRRHEPPPALRRALLRVALAASVCVAAALLFASWRAGIPNRFDEGYDVLFTAARLRAGLRAAPDLLLFFAEQAVEPAHWLLGWPTLALLAIAGLVRGTTGSRRLDPAALGMVVLGGAGLAGYGLAYLVTSWELRELVRVTASRFLVQLLVPAVALASLGLRWLVAGLRP